MGALSLSHWLIVLVVVLLVFGPKRLGSIGQSMGEGLRGLRDGLADKPKPTEQPELKEPSKKVEQEQA